MEIYFAVQNGKMVITRHAFKAQGGIGRTSPIHKFNLPVEKEEVENRKLLHLLIDAYDTDSVFERNLMLSNILLNIKNFRNKKFTAFMVSLWVESMRTLSACLFPENHTVIKDTAFQNQAVEKKATVTTTTTRSLKKLISKKRKKLY